MVSSTIPTSLTSTLPFTSTTLRCSCNARRVSDEHATSTASALTGVIDYAAIHRPEDLPPGLARELAEIVATHDPTFIGHARTLLPELAGIGAVLLSGGGALALWLSYPPFFYGALAFWLFVSAFALRV